MNDSDSLLIVSLTLAFVLNTVRLNAFSDGDLSNQSWIPVVNYRRVLFGNKNFRMDFSHTGANPSQISSVSVSNAIIALFSIIR